MSMCLICRKEDDTCTCPRNLYEYEVFDEKMIDVITESEDVKSVMNKIIERLKGEAKKKDDEATLRPQNEAWLHGVAEGLKEAGDIVVFYRNRAITNKDKL